MSTRRGRRQDEHGEQEEHDNHERWLITYADMVTLLMVLFIVMFAMSAVDERKFNALKAGLAAGFGESTSILDGSDSLLEQPGVSAVEPLNANEFLRELPKDQQLTVTRAMERHDQLTEQRRYAEAEAEVDRLLELIREIKRELAKRGLEDDVRMGIDDRGLVLSLVSKHVVFEPNLSTLSSRGESVLDALAPVLRRIEDPLRIDGHTNQVPVQPKFYPTDWELSAARAVTVLRHLNESSGIPNDRMTMSAFGHEKPLVDPDRPGSQRINKRVDIVIVSSLSPETRALLDNVVDNRQQDEGEDG